MGRYTKNPRQRELHIPMNSLSVAAVGGSKLILFSLPRQVVYILDQVRAMEEEILLRIKQQGLAFKPQILVVS